MENHTLILETPRREIPKEGIAFMVSKLIDGNVTKIEYFGAPIDNQADYIDEEMQRKIDTTTFIEINFETEYALDYDPYNVSNIFETVLHQLEHCKHKEFVANEKDITISLF